jgi:hypothetical protein
MRIFVKHAVFIEPEGALREFILSNKERINSVLPNQPYCHHPPHSTVFISILRGPENWLELLESAVRKVSPFRLQVWETVVFYDDAPAGGGHTMALRAESSVPLLSLQQTVAETLASFVDREALETSSEFFDKEPFRSNCLKYGFAFVGEHWIPHFTIASLHISKKDALITEFENLHPGYDFVIDKVSVWRVEEDNHTKIAVLKLGQS